MGLSKKTWLDVYHYHLAYVDFALFAGRTFEKDIFGLRDMMLPLLCLLVGLSPQNSLIDII